MPASMHRAIVTRVGATGIHVRIDARWPGVEFGPLAILANGVRVGPVSTASSGSPAHTHSVSQSTWAADYIVKGDYVLVAETTTDDFIILGVIRDGMSATGGL